jgi:hypothetical protein
MARKTINTGTSPNKGDGDPLRIAFGKINDNFAELYAGSFAEPSAVGTNLAPDADGTLDLGTADNRWADVYVKDYIYLNGARIEVTSGGSLLVNGGAPSEVQDTVGSVFADDSTLLVDGVSGKIVGPVTGTVTGEVTPSMFKPPMLTQTQIDALTPTVGMMVYNTTTGKFQGYADDANNDSTTGWADLH